MSDPVWKCLYQSEGLVENPHELWSTVLEFIFIAIAKILIANMIKGFLFINLLIFCLSQHHQNDNCRSTTADRTQTVTTGQVTCLTIGCLILNSTEKKYKKSIYLLSKRHH